MPGPCHRRSELERPRPLRPRRNPPARARGSSPRQQRGIPAQNGGPRPHRLGVREAQKGLENHAPSPFSYDPRADREDSTTAVFSSTRSFTF